jgi:putative SOS response-associated peptidase YedK
MCRLYTSHTSAKTLARQFGLAMDLPLPNFPPSWRIATTDPAPVIRRHPKSGERRMDVLRFGLVPHWTKETARGAPVVNVRAETIATSKMFRDAYRQRRCLVPVDEWYEWQALPDGTKQAYAFTRQDGQRMAFAGVWESVRWSNDEILRTFAIVTTKPNAEAAALHDRMPVALTEPEWPLWLGEDDGECDPASLLGTSLDGTLRIWPIRSPLGKTRPNGPELLEPLLDSDSASVVSG